ncbi:MAG: hypothetical protein ACE5E6_12380 [Phycisphaerae bacterium]
MGKADAMWDRARAALLIPCGDHAYDESLWERAVRVARIADLITRLPAVAARRPDATAVCAAALFHDGGWIARLRDEQATLTDIFTRPPMDAHRELGAWLMRKELAGVIPPASLDRASVAIQSLSDRDTDSIEAQVVSEAENLDAFGLAAFWSIVRRNTMEGRGVRAAIDMWQRQQEYHFWTARLEKSFRFDVVRRLAADRLGQFARAMAILEAHHEATDLEAVVRAATSRSTRGVSRHGPPQGRVS